MRGAGPDAGSGHVLVFAVDALPAWEERLAAAQVAIDDRTAYTLYLRDPDGHRVGLTVFRRRLTEECPRKGTRPAGAANIADRGCRMSDVSVKVLGFAGSLRKGSLNRMLLRAAAELAPPGMTIETFDLSGSRSTTATSRPGDPTAVARLQGRDPRGRRAPDRDARIQLRRARRAEERDRLGVAPAGSRC